MQRLRFSRYFKPAMILLDIIVFVIIFYYFFLKTTSFDIQQQEANVTILMLLGFFWVLLSGKTKLYQVQRNLTFTNYLERFFAHIFVFLLVFILLSRVLESHFLKEYVYFIVAAYFSALLFLKSIIFFFLKFIRSKGVNYRNVMFLGDNPSLKILEETIRERKDYGYKIFDYHDGSINLDSLKKFWKLNGIHTLFIPSQNKFEEKIEHQIFEEANNDGVKIILIPNLVNNEFYSYELGYIESQPILSPAKFPLDFFSNYFVKRLIDIIFSIIFILFIGIWLYPLLAILVKIDSSGPILFIQKRYGYRNEIFNCLKFRTMHCSTAKPKIGSCKERITGIGKFLRKTSLDETPQFINVLLGDMSIVGPRPHMILVDELYKPKIRKYGIRNMVKPGITGLAQVSGYRGDKENMDYEMQKRILSDYFYVKNWSFALDLVIILKTMILLIEGDKNAR